MDFPKSVPGVGLIGGKFADEDPAIGRQGSLIPSAWGNAITQELLNVIQAAGLEPNEEQADQLLEAIRILVPERTAFARVSGTLTLPDTAFGIYALADGGAAATVTLPDTEDLVDDTELLLFANHSNTAAVQVKAATGQTVQGPAALMEGSTTAFMLPAGGDWVRLRSEKAQGRWVVVSAFPAVLARIRTEIGIAGQHKNLRASATGTNSLVSVTADDLYVANAVGEVIKLSDVNLTIDTATVGANGLDAGVLASNTWYSAWVISDGANARGLISLSATAPVMPAGYTYKAKVWSVRTDGTANKFPLSAHKAAGLTRYKPAVGSNVTGLPQMASGAAGNVLTPVWVPVSVSAFVPTDAAAIEIMVNPTYSTVIVAPNPSYGPGNSMTNPPPLQLTGNFPSATIGLNVELLLEGDSIYWAATQSTSVGLYVMGWRD